MKSNKKELFYTKFIDENNLININNKKIQIKYWVNTFLISFFSLAIATFPTFVGYNFEIILSIVFFCIDMIFLFFLFYYCIKFIKLDDKYHVFKKKRYLFLLEIPFIILGLSFLVAAIFTVNYTIYSDGSFSVHLNPAYYFFIFIPLFLIHLFFSYYAFMKCFSKYAKPFKNN